MTARKDPTRKGEDPARRAAARKDPAQRVPSRFELVRAGARRDGVEIVQYAQRFEVPGTRAERRVVRTIALFFFVTFLAGLAFAAVYVFWPWRYAVGGGSDKVYTPLLGATLGLALLGLGFGVITLAKKLLPHEVSVQERHPDSSAPDERAMTAATMRNMAAETGLARRPLLTFSLSLGGLGAGIAALMPIGGMIDKPHKHNRLMTTGWHPLPDGGRVRLTHADGTPVRPADVSPGGQITVFPGIPGGAGNEHADSPTLLIHLRDADAATAAAAGARSGKNRGAQWGNFVAFSKICTHAGCPASLFEQKTNKLLCPCHQSQFLITDNARPVFGPATRRLPQLPLDVDAEGYFIAKGDYPEAVGPAFWERP
jgi:ubiquinol-cytochrome c reductase iron-sulfur subunit